MGVYHCQDCGRPVERAIEGELICADCRAAREISAGKVDPEGAIMHWYLTHCHECERPLPGGGICQQCQRELDALLLEGAIYA